MSSADRTSVIVCRGCCCGSDGKHPTTDHEGQVRALADAVRPGGGRIWEVDCLGPCERSNVVVVRTRTGGRRWFGDVLATADTEALAGWIAAGAPDRVPARLSARRFDPDEPRGRDLQPVAIAPDRLTDVTATSASTRTSDRSRATSG